MVLGWLDFDWAQGEEIIMEENKLLPCPFCGELPKVGGLIRADEISCQTNNCPISGFPFDEKEWHRRTARAQDPDPDLIERAQAPLSVVPHRGHKTF